MFSFLDLEATVDSEGIACVQEAQLVFIKSSLYSLGTACDYQVRLVFMRSAVHEFGSLICIKRSLCVLGLT